MNEDSDADDDEDAVDASEDELQRRFEEMTFVVSTSRLTLPQWVKVTDVFSDDSDGELLRSAGVEGSMILGTRSTRSGWLVSVRCGSTYRMDVLERSLSYDEVTKFLFA